MNPGEEAAFDDFDGDPVLDDRWTRDVTVVGPDWDVANIVGDTQVTIVRGVVEVHEKTIRLETSSMWTN